MKFQRNMILSLALLSMLCLNCVFAAADADMTNKPFVLVSVTTSAAFTVKLTIDHEYTIVHLGLQSDGTTASAATDKIFVQQNTDASAASMSDGTKLPILSQGVGVIESNDVAVAPGESNPVIQIKATGNSAKVLIIKGQRVKK